MKLKAYKALSEKVSMFLNEMNSRTKELLNINTLEARKEYFRLLEARTEVCQLICEFGITLRFGSRREIRYSKRISTARINNIIRNIDKEEVRNNFFYEDPTTEEVEKLSKEIEKLK